MRFSSRLVSGAFLVLAAASLLACKKASSVAIGTCGESSIMCGVTVHREGDPPRELKCTPPDTKLPMACECIESGQSMKKVTIVTALPKDLDAAERFARDNCGW